MTAAEKRARILRVVEPTVKGLYPEPEQAERFIKLIREGPDSYINEAWETYFKHTSAAD
jgi:hypothetical protein